MQENVYGGADEQIGFLYEIYGDKFVMEIFLHGPGGCMTIWELSKFAYDWWKDKSKKTVFQYSWNLEENWKNNEDYSYVPRNKLINQYGMPQEADFLGDNYWGHNPTGNGNYDLHICDYNNCIIFVEHENRVSMHYPDELSCVNYDIVNYDIEYQLKLKTFYSGVSSEIGNWQHKKYESFVPLKDFRLYVKEINGRKWIFDFDAVGIKSCYNLYVEKYIIDWYYRLHIRNKTVVADLSEFTGIDLSYDMNSGDNLHGDPDTLDVSDFKFHHTE